MTFNEIAIEVAKLEGKKQSISIAQIKEVLSITAKIIAKNPKALITLLKIGSK